MFIINSLLLGIGLAMDAFSVSLADGLNDRAMKLPSVLKISGVFAFFQGLMPLLGWICVHTIAEHFENFSKFIPWIALALLGYIGGKMLLEGIRCSSEASVCTKLTFSALLIQGVATSIDALSVGFTISEYGFGKALAAVVIIAAATFIICTLGVYLGKKFGTYLSNKASIIGGIILIFIGIEIFVTGIL